MALELHDLLYCEYSRKGDGPYEYNCWNLCREVYRRAGRELPLYSEYIRSIAGRSRLIKRIKDGGDFERLSGAELLAIVTLRTSGLRPGCITHIGVVVGPNRFIHINRKKGVVIARLDDRRWKNRIEGFYRYVADNSH